MSRAASYAIAESDELEAFGGDDVAVDTSAGILPGDEVEPIVYEQQAAVRGKSRFCLFVVIVVLIISALAAFFGVFLARRGENDSASTAPAAGTQDTAITDGSGPQVEPATVPPATVPPETVPPETASPAPVKVRKYAVRVLDKKPHDAMAFTQGFEYANGTFYESTGLRGMSSLRKVEIETGKVLQKYQFADMTLFGEGMTLYATDYIFMLTWQAGRGFVFNQSTLEVIREWKYDGEGWGLCIDDEAGEVYMSDGTSEMRVLEPENLEELRRVRVTLNGKAVQNLNEIEWICGEIWANVWLTSLIYRIDPKTGVVKSVIDASILPLKGDQRHTNDVLNGIAFDKQTGRLWLTGKKWPVIYQVAVTDDSLDLTKCK